MSARRALAAVALVGATALGLAACGGGTPDPLDTATDAQVAYFNAYADSVAPAAFGGTYAEAIELGDAVCADLDGGLTVANLLDPADPDLEASKAVVAAAVTHLCPAYADQVELLTGGN